MHPGAVDPAKPAIVMSGSGEVVTYGELDAAANRISHVFRSLGLAAGDHIAFCLENSARFLELCWGAQYAGLIYTACSTRLTGRELGYIVDDCGAKAAVLSVRYADRAADLDACTPNVDARFSLGGDVPGYEPLEPRLAEQPDMPLEEDRIAGRDMLYSSGTTGQPKGIRQTDPTASLDEPIMVTNMLRGVLGAGTEDVYLSPAPLYHAAPLRFCMAMHQLGGTTIVMERFDEQALLDLVGRNRVTLTQLVPTMFVRMLRLPDATREAADLSSLRVAVHAAAPCPPEVKRAMIDWWGPIIHEYYGSTEGCGITWITSEEWLEHPGSVGRGVVGQPRIVGEDGSEVGAGETGEVRFSDGPTFAYHNDSEKTKAAIDERGWAWFGDIGHVDDDGFLYLTDRASYTIITGGVNVYPQEAEDTLLSHDAVMDAAVFGVPHPEFGEQVKAVVQPREMPADDAAAGALADELVAFCRSKLADVKCPRSVDFRSELPRAETGKLYKRLLKEEYGAGQAEAG